MQSRLANTLLNTAKSAALACLFGGAIACGTTAPQKTPAVTPVQAKQPSKSKASDASDHPPAAWQSLVADERIVRRPDLDGTCDAAQSAFFIPRWYRDASVSAVYPPDLGCVSPARSSGPEERTPLGIAYCCPDGRNAALPHTAAAPSCEQAVLDYARRTTVVLAEGVNAGPFGHILNRGSYFEHCAIPHSTGIDICVAVLEGRAVGVTVQTNPLSSADAECVAQSILHLTFPSSPRMDVAFTKY